MKLLKKNSLLTLFISACFLPLNSYANSISFDDVKKDVTFLASDALKGRENFTAEIDNAADYIASRFKDIGLSPFNDSYKQIFSIYHFVPESIEVEINNQSINSKNIAVVGTNNSLQWQTDSAVKTTYVNESDDMRAIIAMLNNKGGDHLVILHSDHSELFQRYQHYFQQGISKLAKENTGSLVIILNNSNESANVEQLTVKATIKIQEQALTNVVGVLKGKDEDASKESVVFSAHYDHLGEILADGNNDKIYNGADDNASGTTGVINLASYYAKQATNKRSLIFVAFSAEEIGGFGSQYFSSHISPDSITAMINIEMIGKPSKFGEGSLWLTGPERSNLLEIMNGAVKPLNQEIHPDPYPEQGLFYRSDNATLARLGVPAHSFSSVQLDQDQHYHQVSDDLSSLNLQSMHQVIQTLAIASEPLVNGNATPSRIDTSKVNPKGKIF